MDRSQDDESQSRSHPIQEDMRLQRMLWAVERFGWGLLVLVVVLTILGLFSTGLLSQANRASPGGALVAEYQRFERNGASSELLVRVRAAEDGKAVLGIEGDFFDSFTVEGLQPQPLSSRSRDKGAEYVFAADDRGWATVRLSLRAQRFGLSRSRLATPSGSLEIRQFIYP